MKHIKLFNAFEIDLERICNLYDEIIEFLASDAKFYYDEIQIPKCFGAQNNILNLIEVTGMHDKVKFYESEHTMRDVTDPLIEHTRTKRKFIMVYINVPPEHIRSLTTVLNAIKNGGLNLTNLTIMIPFEIKEGVASLKLDESIMKRVMWYHTSREADNKRGITMPDISCPNCFGYIDIETDMVRLPSGLRDADDACLKHVKPFAGLHKKTYDMPFTGNHRDIGVMLNESLFNTIKNNRILKDILESTQKAAKEYHKPKLEISEVTSHDDGSISVKIHIDEEAQKRARRDAFVNIIRAVNKTLAEHEEEILNGE